MKKSSGHLIEFKELLKIFTQIEKTLMELGQDSDKSSFAEIKENLNNPARLDSSKFAEEIIYVILTSGFNQKTAKKYFYLIVDYLYSTSDASFNELIKIFRNKQKIKAILKVWKNKEGYCNRFYSIKKDEDKLNFLQTLPHIGNITKHHIGRNLGLNVVKYDIWIQRLGVRLYGSENDLKKIDNSKLHPDVKTACDKMFDTLSKELGLKRGYIDVVLWRGCREGLLAIDY